ncbi:murein DD-endopeptidase MepM [mine drainage metagenome]|uniref:Murein DD-endopeptidase MepM n=1 Tax=mine drainage metagenome TaxID=410659 RepID=A0A1J5REL8_9ZZZZ
MQKGKSGILAQISASQERKLRLRWLLLASCVPLFGIVTAFGIAPQTNDAIVPVSTVIEEISLPQSVAADHVDSAPVWQADQVKQDDTLSNLLDRLNIHNTEAIDFIQHAPEASPFPSQLRPGRNVLAKTLEDGELLELLYQTSPDTALQIKHISGVYHAQQVHVTLENRTLLKSAEIQSSLFSATDEAGIPDSIATQLADIFSSEIDFHLDLRKGDRFSVVYDASYNNGAMVKTGRVLSAEFVNQGKTYHAVLYRDQTGHSNYYTPEGQSLHKSFLRSPLEFTRISSGFSLARFHPLLKTWRAHKGVDYAAPIGTHIKATADGIVKFVGTQGGYGNVIILQHAGDISTVYGHLSHFASGLHAGQKVSQGEIIGQVGMSGLATGPHLHYEYRIHGVYHDPLTVALSTSAPLSRNELASFERQTAPLVVQLAMLRQTNTAALD